MSKHTPGPWTAEKDYTTLTGEYVEPMIWAGANTATPKHIAVVRIGLEGTQANARLIATAPDLLEAIRKLANDASGFLALSDVERHGMTNSRILRDRIEEARDAIAKAEDQ